jgi:hypothetical protein
MFAKGDSTDGKVAKKIGFSYLTVGSWGKDF